METQAPFKYAILDALKDCGKNKDLRRGTMLHTVVLETGLDSNMYIASTLVNMYAKCGRLVEARKVFDGMQNRDVVAWNALLLGYVDNGQPHVTLELFVLMDCAPDFLTFVACLKACIDVATLENNYIHKQVKMVSLEKGMAIHSRALEHCNGLHMRLSNVLLDMYSKCGSLLDAQYVFDSMQQRDVVSWTSLILGYALHGQGKIASMVFCKMLHEGFTPNSITLVAALKASSDMGLEGLKNLNDIQSIFMKNGCEPNLYVLNTLIDMYAKCKSIEKAREIFDAMSNRDVISWNVLISGYIENERGEMALEVFSQMKREGFVPDVLTFVAALKACTSLMSREDLKMHALENGVAIQLEARKRNCELNKYVASTIVDMHCKSGNVDIARDLFETMPDRDVVAWNALIMGYTENGKGVEALDLFFRMKREGCKPNSLAFVAALKACAIIGALDHGKALHTEIRALGMEKDIFVATSLVDFYARCSSITDAREVFDLIPNKNSAAWGAILGAYSRQGDTQQVFELFEKMEDDQVTPSVITFMNLLSACNHAGHVDRAKEYFASMITKYEIRPSIEHYTCLIDLFGRADKLDEAWKLINSMPFSPDSVTWIAVLGACSKCKNLEIGKLAFQALLNLDPTNDCIYVLMADIYQSKGMYRDVEALKPNA